MAARNKSEPTALGPELMTAPEVARYLKIHRTTLHRLIKAEQLPHFRIGNGYRFHREAIDKWRKFKEMWDSARPGPPG